MYWFNQYSKNSYFELRNTVATVIAIGLLNMCTALQALPLPSQSASATKSLYSLEELTKYTNQFIIDKNFAAAMALLNQHTNTYNNQPVYDRLLAKVAWQQTDYLRASFALERIVARNPAAAEPRLKLAIAYFKLGEYRLALPLLEMLSNSQAPTETQQVIENYLQASRQYTKQDNTHWWARVNTALGYSNNANSATNDPEFLGFTLATENQRQASPYWRLGASGGVHMPTTDNQALQALLQAENNQYSKAEFVDRLIANVRLAYAWRFTDKTINLSVQHSHNRLDGDYSYRATGGGLQFKQTINQSLALLLAVQYTQIHFAAEQANRNTGQTTYSLTTMLSDVISSNDQFLFGFSAGQYNHIDEGSELFERDFHSLRMDYSLPISRQWLAHAQLLTTRTQYKALFFGQNRVQTTRSANLRLQHRQLFGSQWNILFDTQYIDEDSSIDLFAYRGWQAQIGLQRHFN